MRAKLPFVSSRYATYAEILTAARVESSSGNKGGIITLLETTTSEGRLPERESKK
jgi:hypothetical protein